jgi:hypothetical protein
MTNTFASLRAAARRAAIHFYVREWIALNRAGKSGLLLRLQLIAMTRGKYFVRKMRRNDAGKIF